MPSSASQIQDVYRTPLPEDPTNRDTALSGKPGSSTHDALVDQLPADRDPRARATIRTPKRPGVSGTRGEYDRLLVVLEEQVRREHDTWTDEAIFAEAERRYSEAVSDPHPLFLDEYVKLTQTSWTPNRALLRENIEIAACRRLPELQAIEAKLRACDFGRPTGRDLPLAVLLRSALGAGRPDIRSNHEAFGGSDRELDWAYLDSDDMAVNRLKMRDLSTVRKTLKAMLDRNDPQMLLNANLQILKRIRDRHADEDGFSDVGQYWVIDGTDIVANVEQTVPVNDEHLKLIAKSTGARFAYHGTASRVRKAWVGWKLLVISDLITGLPLIWTLLPGQEREFVHTIPLIEELFARAPWIDPQYLVGDAEFDVSARLAFDLERRYGIHPVFPLRETVGRKWDWGAQRGVPHCSKHGAMKRVQAEAFHDQHAEPRRYEPDFDTARKGWKARIRWECTACKSAGVPLTETTYPKRNARLYTYLPRGGEHRLYATRLALMRRRNAIECVFAALKHRGIGDRDHHKIRWVTRAHHMQWAVGLALLGMTLRREAHETGLYEQCAEEAWARDLIKVQPPELPRCRARSKPRKTAAA